MLLLLIDVFTFLSKWKGDKHAVKSIHASSHGNILLSAGRSIKLWDLEKKEILKVSSTLPFACTGKFLEP